MAPYMLSGAMLLSATMECWKDSPQTLEALNHINEKMFTATRNS